LSQRPLLEAPEQNTRLVNPITSKSVPAFSLLHVTVGGAVLVGNVVGDGVSCVVSDGVGDGVGEAVGDGVGD
jgi:hypothetical protein